VHQYYKQRKKHILSYVFISKKRPRVSCCTSFIVNGEFDGENSEIIEVEPATDGTLDRLTPSNGLATIDGLDHYSIANKLIAGAAKNDQDSTKSREFQVEAAVGALDSWFVTSIKEKFDKTCLDLVKDAQASGYALSRCEVTDE
jgi:hypothetical protein